MDKAFVGGLYRKLGLTVKAEEVDAVSNFVEKIQPDIGFDEALALISVVFSLPVELSKLKNVFDAAQEFIPGFGSDGINKEVELVSSLILREEIAVKSQISGAVCLAIETTNFGGMRKSSIDPSIVSFATAKLAEFQQAKSKLISYQTPEKPKDLDTKYKAAEDLSANNNWSQGWTTVKPILQDGFKFTSSVNTTMVAKYNALANYTKELEKQMQAQWFAISAWCQDGGKPLSEFSIAEASLRAGIELGKIFAGGYGAISTPALLKLAIDNGRKLSTVKNFAFSLGCVASTLENRKQWVKHEADENTLLLTPLLFAVVLACDNDDDDNWTRLFSKKLGFDPNFEISPYQFSLQIYKELLVMTLREEHA